jgi:uncharacterized protein
MIHLTRALVRRWLDALLHVDDTPERTAAAFAVGVFFGFGPLLGFHTVLALVAAFLMNYSRVAVLLGVYSNLPWIVAEYYTFTTVIVGAPLTHAQIPPGFGSRLDQLFQCAPFGADFWHQLATLVRPLLLPYTVGSTIGAIALGAAAYPLALAFIRSRRRIRQFMHHERPRT